MKRTKYKINFIRLNGKTWFMVCTRSYVSCLKLALKHFFKGHCILNDALKTFVRGIEYGCVLHIITF